MTSRKATERREHDTERGHRGGHKLPRNAHSLRRRAVDSTDGNSSGYAPTKRGNRRRGADSTEGSSSGRATNKRSKRRDVDYKTDAATLKAQALPTSRQAVPSLVDAASSGQLQSFTSRTVSSDHRTPPLDSGFIRPAVAGATVAARDASHIEVVQHDYHHHDYRKRERITSMQYFVGSERLRVSSAANA